MEIFLEKMKQLLPVLGSEIVVPVASAKPEDDESQKLTCAIKGLRALGARTTSGFVVFKGSSAVLKDRPSAAAQHPFVVSLRRKLEADGTLVESDGSYTFTGDVEFTSPSAAAAVVHGGGANGLTAWRTAAGKTLKELEARDVQQHDEAGEAPPRSLS
jgi:hypothetical protein